MEFTTETRKKLLEEMYSEYKKETEFMFKEQEKNMISIISANTKMTNDRMDKVEKDTHNNAKRIKSLETEVASIVESLNFHEELFDRKIKTFYDSHDKENVLSKGAIINNSDIIEVMKNTNKESVRLLNARIDELNRELKSAPSPKKSESFATILKGKTADEVQQRHRLINIVTAETENRQNRASNVIIVGLPKLDEYDDIIATNKFFNACGIDSAKIGYVSRIKSSKKNNAILNSNIVKVSLINEQSRSEVLQKCSHHNIAEFKGIFCREDRTRSQQEEFNELRSKMKKLNDQLYAAEVLDRPFRNVIHKRTGEICCIDVQKSNEQHKYVFASPANTLAQHRKSLLTAVQTATT